MASVPKWQRAQKLGSQTTAAPYRGLLTSFLGRAMGTSLNVRLHCTEGETEAQTSAWSTVIQVGRWKQNLDPAGLTVEPGTLSTLLSEPGLVCLQG